MSRKRILQNYPRLSRWQAMLLLLVFLSARGLVPAGFMPAAFAAGTPYGLCHGDSRSALLLNALTNPIQQHHHGHQADHLDGHNHNTLTAHSFADNYCSFSVVTNIVSAPATDLGLPSAEAVVATSPFSFTLAPSSAYTRPLIRAPPH
ncbi:hypothetical protein [Microbulbifer epialgicus]|uniref:DUF2946 domain-containing protein n=1 Tax=Microbulbifer epialgicus TaxID=393907 RepID=A0ABV4NUS6_9GAMM